jgi:hypothetical protein
MKPIKNFRDKLNGIEIWRDGIMFRLKLPMIGAEDLLWIMPENVENKWNAYIKFRWEEEEYFLTRSEVNGSKTELLSNGKIEREKVRSYAEFMNDFLHPIVKDLLIKEKFF